ncbi:MAG TPA: UDP-glucose/GDP-mannose dehydrogenase family protein [Dehalococcoidia bacterium]|nr:UDP-glucose/GDP-mannose dehydrogenase family protein [Dehalococcoidia bacterium]
MSGERIAVLGCGHVGVVTAACLAKLGHSVAGVDIDPELVARLGDGRIPYLEPGLSELVATNLKAGRLRFTTSYAEGLEGAGFVFLCVNTPATPTGAADLRSVRRAVGQVAEVLAQSKLRPLIVNKSTSPIGTGETIDATLARSFAPEKSPDIVANPEFLREGHGVEDFFQPQRIVIGAERRQDAERVAALYSEIDAPVVITDLRSAEMIKYVSNAFLATKVSFINEIARLCEQLEVDIDVVAHGASLDQRIGGSYLNPGIGYGGSCLPKDVAALCHSGDSAGVTMRVLSAVQEVNLAQRKHAVNSIRRVLGPLDAKTIAVWGASFKGGSEDLRESPAIDVISLLRNEGATVKVYDPSLGAEDSLPFADLICGTPLECARNADAVAVLTDWPEFAGIDLGEVAQAMRGKLIYDGRNVYGREQVEAAGLTYYGVGRRPRTATRVET